MAGSKSNAHETKVLNYWLGKSFTSTASANVFLRLYNSTVNDTVTGATDQVGTGTHNYTQLSVTNSSANWTNSTSGGSKTNKTTLTFTPSSGASTGWGTIKSMSIATSNSTTATDNIIYWADLTVNQTVSQGNTVRFSTGAIVITED